MPNFYNLLRARKFTTAADTALEIAPYNSATPNFSIDAGGKISWSSGSAVADTNLYRASADTLRTDDSLIVIGSLTAATPSFTGPTTVTGSLTLSGDLTVNGTTTTVNSTTLTVDDKNIELASTASPTNAAADGGGITLKGTTDKTFNWLNATSSWTSSEDVDLATGKSYYINGSQVLSSTTLGSGVTSSSLTSVGQINSLQATTPSFSGQATFSGPTLINNTITLQQSLEKINPIGNITGTTAIDVLTSAVHTGTGTGNFTFNFRADGSTTLNSLMSNNQSMTIVVMVSNTTARTLSAVQIDGSTVTPLWFGGTGTPAGNANSTDIYTFSIIKTASNTFTVYASQSKFA